MTSETQNYPNFVRLRSLALSFWKAVRLSTCVQVRMLLCIVAVSYPLQSSKVPLVICFICARENFKIASTCVNSLLRKTSPL